MTPVVILLQRSFRRILLLSGISAIVTAILVSRLPQGVEAVQTFTIPIPQRPPSDTYEYDGYYALQATDLFSQTLAGWLTAPDFVAKIFRAARIPQERLSVRRLAQVFTVRRLSGQLVELRLHARSESEAQEMLEAIRDAVRERTVRFNEEGQSTVKFRVATNEPLLVPVQRSIPLRALIAAVVTFIVAVNVLVIWDMLRTTGEHQGLAKTL